jgi:hypothetical protein
MDNVQSEGKRSTRTGIVSVLLGFLGAVNSAVIAFFLISTLSTIIPSFNHTIETFIIIITTMAIAAVLIYGSHLILTTNPKKGGKMNIAAGCLETCVYIYYSVLSQPNLLSWLNPIGILLLLPPLLSGLIAQLYPR